MNLVEKRDFIHSYLYQADEDVINELYEKLTKEKLLKEKLESRAIKSEDDIQSGKTLSRPEIEKRTAGIGR